MHNSGSSLQTTKKSVQDVDIVQNYLDTLLRDISAGLQHEEFPATQLRAEVQTAVKLPGPAETTVTRSSPIVSAAPAPLIKEFAPAPVVQTVQKHVAVTRDPAPALATEDVQIRDTPPQLSTGTERIMPDWAQRGFAGLLFEVAGLKMAAPLHALGGISLIDDRLQPVVGQADWFMGLLRWNGRNLRVVDTARFVMPERLENNDHRSAYQSVVVLGDSHWALAVDCAHESVNLKADEIRWKHLTGARPWLAGTLLQRLCALLDVDRLLSMLQQTELDIREISDREHLN